MCCSLKHAYYYMGYCCVQFDDRILLLVIFVVCVVLCLNKYLMRHLLAVSTTESSISQNIIEDQKMEQYRQTYAKW